MRLPPTKGGEPQSVDENYPRIRISFDPVGDLRQTTEVLKNSI